MLADWQRNLLTHPASPNDRLPVPAFGEAVFAAESKANTWASE